MMFSIAYLDVILGRTRGRRYRESRHREQPKSRRVDKELCRNRQSLVERSRSRDCQVAGSREKKTYKELFFASKNKKERRIMK